MVRFGHDGWLGELAYDLTYESIVNVAVAAGITMTRDSRNHGPLIIAHDRRFLGDEFSRAISRELASLGVEIIRLTEPFPAPVFSSAITQTDAVGGIMVSGGQAPITRNGLLLRGPDGGALPRWMLDQISDVSQSGLPVSRVGPTARVRTWDPLERYLDVLESRFPLSAIRNAGITVAVDCLWGTGSGILPLVVDGDGSRTIEFRTAHNPLFPELSSLTPDVSNLERLQKIVRTGDAAIGIGLSADGCNAAILDERGIVLQPGMVSALTAWHRFHHRKQAGTIARSIGASTSIDAITRRTGVMLHELPYGYTAVCETLRETSPELAWDESGGLIIPNIGMERDGIAQSLCILSLMIDTEAELSDLVAEVHHVTGPRVLLRSRIDLAVDKSDLARVRIERESWPDQVAGLPVLEQYLTDGVSLELGERAWLLIRYDEIEGALYIIAEAESDERASAILEAGRFMMLL